MAENTTQTLTDMRRRAQELHAAGRLPEAIALQAAAVNKAIDLKQVETGDFHRLGLMLFATRDFASAITAFEQLKKHDSGFPGVSLNLGLCLIRVERFQDALLELQTAAKKTPDNVDLLDGLADVYGKMGDLDNARVCGERSLRAKDRLAKVPPPGFAFPEKTPPPFRIDRAAENVISFTLFGTETRYLRGAVKNAVIATGLYPGWRCRFYCDDTVPAATRSALADAGGDVQMMPRPVRPADGLFWRFLVWDDPDVKRFLIRDCDSVLNIRERRAVDEWLTSNKHFHVMRDHTSHTALILAGMWGGVVGVLPPLQMLLKEFNYKPLTESRTADQLFLGEVVWPMIKESCLIHDRVYRVFGAQPFPSRADLPPGRHVGDNDAAFA